MKPLTNWVSRFAFVLALAGFSSCGSGSSNPAQNPTVNTWPMAQISSRVEHSGGALVVSNSAGKIIFTQSMPIDDYKLTSQLLVVRYQDQGPRILIINADGRYLLTSGLLYQDAHGRPAEVKVSDGIVAIQYYSDGSRILAMNAAGDILVSPAYLYENARIDISDHILGMTYEDQGSRVYAVNYQGRVLVNASDIYEEPKIKVEGDRISVRSKNHPAFSVDMNGVPVTVRRR